MAWLNQHPTKPEMRAWATELEELTTIARDLTKRITKLQDQIASYTQIGWRTTETVEENRQ